MTDDDFTGEGGFKRCALCGTVYQRGVAHCCGPWRGRPPREARRELWALAIVAAAVIAAWLLSWWLT